MGLDETCILYIDGGTTRTRAWAAVADRVVAAAQVAAGARDAARGSPALAEGVRHLILEIEDQCRAAGQPPPARAVAAGMITSPQGLVEVPHVQAPAGAADLARAVVCRTLADVSRLEIVLVPGVRTGGPRASRETVGEGDVMRGEEVLALGLARQRRLSRGEVLLSLGSHWKTVHVDDRGRVAGSRSALSGELIESVRSHTILASALPPEWPATLPEDWVAAGFESGRRDGLPRALYAVRLLEQRVASEPEERLAFLVGATIAASTDTLVPPGAATPDGVVLAGPSALTDAWGAVLRARGREPLVLFDEEASAAFRSGCKAVLDAVRPPRSAATPPPGREER
jgi:2-dehydro-3-deoxygalactonokinase